MKLCAAAAAFLIVAMNLASAKATVRISDDNGGQIGKYLDRFPRRARTRRQGRDRRRLRLGLHHVAWRHPAQPHLRDAARRARFPLGLGSDVDGSAKQQCRQRLSVGELSGRRAQVDCPAWRAARADHLFERTRTDGNVSALSLTAAAKRAGGDETLRIAPGARDFFRTMFVAQS